jgi:hypothetical protein
MLFSSLQKEAIRVVSESLGFFGKAIAQVYSPSLFHICVVHGHEIYFFLFIIVFNSCFFNNVYACVCFVVIDNFSN